MDKEKLMLLQLLPQLGINLDPVAQSTSLVNLINESEKPQIQQGQFDRQMGMQEQQMANDQQYKQGMMQMYQQNADQDVLRNKQNPLLMLLQQVLGQQEAGFNNNVGALPRLIEMLGLPEGLLGPGQVPQDPRFGQPGNEQGISDEAYQEALRKRGWAPGVQ
jgi:hypothetical protein